MSSLGRAIKPLRACAIAASLCVSAAAHASLVSINFDTAATGANLITTPLVVAGVGTVTLSAQGGGSLSLTATTTGSGLFHNQLGIDSRRALFSFDFDVSSITFSYAGNNLGAFVAEALDISGSVIASFSDPDTSCNAGTCFDGSPTLTAAGIRGFRFADAPNGASFSVIDNLSLTTAAAVPIAPTLALSGLALALLGATRRKSAVAA